MFPPRPTALAHVIASQIVPAGALVIDATCGNGHDTLHLARLVGPQGRLIAFDIQAQAIENTQQRLKSENLHDGRVTLIQACHSTLGKHVASRACTLIMFNLGYLPGGDRSRTTTVRTTLAALDAAMSILLPGGMLMVTCYPGHVEGANEARHMESWMKCAASSGHKIARYDQPFTQGIAPVLWLVGHS